MRAGRRRHARAEGGCTGQAASGHHGGDLNDVVIIVLGEIDRAAEGLAGAGKRLAEQTGGRLVAITGNEPDLPEARLAMLTQLCRDLAPRAILLANDTASQEIAPRLAHRLGGSAVGDATDVTLAGDALRVTRQVYGGKAQTVIEVKRKPGVVWTRARALAPAPWSAVTSVTALKAAAPPPHSKARVTARDEQPATEARLEDARVIVSGGRGIGGPEGFTAELKPLAELLHAQLAASRAACDAGWVPPTWQVGQTGKKVAPDLYLAIAITGASQHMAGISEARNIAAINIDPDAPIFKHCRFGIVEDYRRVVPLLRRKLAELQNHHE